MARDDCTSARSCSVAAVLSTFFEPFFVGNWVEQPLQAWLKSEAFPITNNAMKTLPFVSVFLAWQGFGTLAASVAALLMVPVAAQAADPIAPLNPPLGRSLDHLGQPWPQPIDKRPAQPLDKQLNPCESFSYIYTEDGRCIDLSYMNKPPEPRLVTQFMGALRAIGVPVAKKACADEEGVISYGYYDVEVNEMVLCVNNTKDNSQAMINTLVHESWHTVQDCAAGLENSEDVAIFAGDTSEQFETVVSGLSVSDITTLLALYPEEQLVTEAEARYMENYPSQVLEALAVCATLSAKP